MVLFSRENSECPFRGSAGGRRLGEIGERQDHVQVSVWQLAPVDTASHAVRRVGHGIRQRSEEHTSELQSRGHLVCRLLLEKKKTKKKSTIEKYTDMS